MRPLRVVHQQTSLGDLQDIYQYLRDRGTSAAVSRGYVRRLRATCEGIGKAPNGGRPRDDLQPGLRTWSFERRATIAYTIRAGEVLVGNVFYAGRDIDALFARRSSRHEDLD